MKKKPKTGILQRFFKIICLAVTLTSAGFLIYHMVYLPMENKFVPVPTETSRCGGSAGVLKSS